MKNFIELATYNPLTTQGERRKHININQVVYVEDLTIWTSNNNRVDGIKTRITLSTGELLDVKETFNEILNLTNK